MEPPAIDAGGAVVFDEYHQYRGATVVPLNLLVTGLQLGFLALLFVFARASRLGPARDAKLTWHRSSLEYVSAMAALTRNAGVERELVVALKTDFRSMLRDRQGIPLSWSWAEADVELGRRGLISPGALVNASGEAAFVRLSRGLAELERRLR